MHLHSPNDVPCAAQASRLTPGVAADDDLPHVARSERRQLTPRVERQEAGLIRIRGARITFMLLAVSTSGALQLAMAKSEHAAPSVFYASQSGKSTLDQGQGGGNPFASALVELLG